MLKNLIYSISTVGILFFQNCNAMREYAMAAACLEYSEKLDQAIEEKITRGYANKTVEGTRPNAYDMVIDKFESQIPLGREEFNYTLFNCEYSRRFYNCQNNICTIADHILAIDQKVFCKNKSFTKVQLPQNLLGIGCMAFAYSDLEEIDIPDSVIAIASFAFAKCEKLKHVTLSKNTIICNGAFAMCPHVELIYRDTRRNQHGVF